MSESPLATISQVTSQVTQQFGVLRPAAGDDDVSILLRDTSDLFTLWCSNLGAHHAAANRLSVEYRLREAPRLIDEIRTLLYDLLETLNDLAGAFTNPSLPQDGNELYSVEDDTIVTSTGLVNTVARVEERQELLEMADDCIRSLLRLSVLIRSAAPSDRYQRALQKSNLHFIDQLDVIYVGDKYPKLSQGNYDWLRLRLGRAISDRRRALAYYRDHCEQIEQGLHQDNMTPDKHELQVKSSELIATQQGNAAVAPSIVRSARVSTHASTFHLDTFIEQRDLGEVDDALSCTTIGDELHHDEDQDASLRSAILGSLARYNEEFECPLCRRIQKFESDRKWRRHVFDDLRAYVCCAGQRECDLAIFKDRKEWFHHELQNHRKQWGCLICKREPFREQSKFELHLATEHPNIPKAQHPSLFRACQESLSHIPALDCPFCDSWEATLRKRQQPISQSFSSTENDTILVHWKQFRRHLAAHLEQLALFAARSYLIHEGDEDTSVGSAAVASNCSNRLLPSLDTSIGMTEGSTRSQRRRYDSLEDVLSSIYHEAITFETRSDHSGVLKTQLMQHQERAFAFISQRESGNITSDLTLWKETSVDTEKPFYQHILTGAKSDQQEDVLGGIFADDMGLGKSLVMLAIIAASLGRAKEFSVLKNRPDKDAQRSGQRNSRATLILVPSILLIDSWIDELRRHVQPGGLKFFKYFGPKRHAEQQALLDNDIIFTTYGTLASEWTGEQSLLKHITWFRIILDEAHEIRNRSTAKYQAVCALPANHRWCLTATPVQEKLEDLASLTLFLRVPGLENINIFRKYVVTPTVLKGFAGGFKNLHTLLHTICIRRTREYLPFSNLKTETKMVLLSAEEKAVYSKLFDDIRQDINMVINGGGARTIQVSSAVLRGIYLLRLFCNVGLRKSNAAGKAAWQIQTDDELFSELEMLGKNNCATCSKTILSVDSQDKCDGGVLMPSCQQHLICHVCVPEVNMSNALCGYCNQGEQAIKQHNERPNAPGFSLDTAQPFYEPSKLQALLRDIREDLSRKCVVFSSWIKTLEIAEVMMQEANLRYTMIHGGLSLQKRADGLNNFRSPMGPNILLMTFGTGRVSGDLHVASRIYIMEPQWNPSAEGQAIGRVLSIGQSNPVTVVRFITKNTIEQHALMHQTKETELGSAIFLKEKLKESLEFFQLDPDQFALEDSESAVDSESEAEEVHNGKKVRVNNSRSHDNV